MNKRLISIISIFSLCVAMTGCSNKNNDSSSNSTENSQITTTSPKSESIGEIDTYVKLSDNNTTVDGEGVTVENNTITITNAGTYSISGSLSDGQVIINTNKEEKTYILLDGANITCSNSAAINVISSKKTVISLAEGTQNYIRDGSEYVFEDETTDEPNAAIFSKEDLTFIGTGSLEVSGNYDRSIVSKDDLVIQDGNINVTSVGDVLRGKDSVVVTGGNITINAGGDGIDSNGNIEMTDGVVIVNGPTNGGNGALDYDGNFNISGGTLVAAGSLGMVQTPSDASSQNSLNISVSQQDANSIIHVEDESGNNVLTFAPSKTYQSVVVSSPEIKSNSTYKVYVGGSSTGTQSDGLYSGGTYSKGTEIGSTTVSSSITSITQDGISSGGSIGMPRGGRGGNKGNMQSAPQSNVRNENTQQGNIEGEIQ